MAPKSKVKASKLSTPKEHRPEPTQPNWPSLAPLVPSLDLFLETLLEDQILIIRNLFTSTLCKNYVAYLATLPLATTPGKPKRGEAVRVNDRFQVEDSAFAKLLWEKTALKELVSSRDSRLWGGEVLGLSSNIRIYRYKPGQFFDQHYDESNRLCYGPEKTPARTTWTLLIYLSVCEGGATVFYPEPAGHTGANAEPPVTAAPEIGLALLHRHGDDCLLHEGKEVTSGEKWVLRSDLVVKR